ncbi:hypothetical protein LX97_01660 [Nonlabens dokdonensis]|uniref:Secreted protein n=1 Tax=Nonlabens dokdonensis TaxID=328515 RepID=A0ABX5PYC5_9FLAO|nr:hypothetical protein [Nonlabens dokdonensis]PZX40887.1 hypothetical protein LX97_01660 [Nonlabens dokdonensis]
MRIKFLSIVAFLLSFFYSNATMVKEKYVVINPEGTKIYDQPKFDSKVVAYLNFGDLVLKSESIVSKDLLLVANNIRLPGNWIVVNKENTKAYIFSAHLSNRENILYVDDHGAKTYNLKGELLGSSTNTISKPTTSGGTFKTTTKDEEFENALRKEIFTDCLFVTINYKSADLNELYFEVIHKFVPLSQDGQLELPVRNFQKYNEVIFESMGALEDLKITISGEEGSVISYYTCD